VIFMPEIEIQRYNFIINKKVKLLFVIPSFIGGGAERVFLNIINRIDRSKHDVHLAVGVMEGEYIKYLPSDIVVHQLGHTRASKSIFSLFRVVWKLKPDIVFSTLGFVVSSSIASIFFPKKTKLVTRFGNTVSPFLAEIKENNRFKCFVYYALNYLTVYFSDVVVVQSNYMKNDLIDTFSLSEMNASKIIKINNPVDLENINKLLEKKNTDFTNMYNFAGPHFISIGSFKKQKGFDILLEAFKIIQEEVPDVTLTIIGEGDEREKLELLISKLQIDNKVFLPGFSDNPYSMLIGADIFVSSSRYEGFSNAVLESLILGVPVVATDCPSGIRELVNNEKNGWLVSMEGDLVENLSRTMLQSLRQYKKLDMETEKSEIKPKYGVDEVSSKYGDLFQSL